MVRISTYDSSDLESQEIEQISELLSSYHSKELRLIFGQDCEVYPGELSFSLIAYTNKGLKPRPRRKTGLCRSPYPREIAHYIV